MDVIYHKLETKFNLQTSENNKSIVDNYLTSVLDLDQVDDEVLTEFNQVIDNDSVHNVDGYHEDDIILRARGGYLNTLFLKLLTRTLDLENQD